MPSPIGHGVFALVLEALTRRAGGDIVLRSMVFLGAAVAPDLDLLLRFVDGRNHHQAESHSVGCAIAAGLLVGVLSKLARWPRPGSLGCAAGLGWMSHVALDYLGRDTNPPIGVMALWPVSTSYHKFPWPFFLDIGRTLEWATVWNNFVAVLWELVVLVPLLAAARRLRSPETSRTG